MINHIDLDKCTGCGTCFKTCALDVFRLETNQKKCSPCSMECPADTDMRAYNYLLQQGKIDEAANKLKEKNPFPSITGRVCPHTCETKCQRANIDKAVNINGLEQFLGDTTLDDMPEKSGAEHVGKVAIVGSGPAGLSCAWFLAKNSFPVTVYECKDKIGGMLRYGIPAYRMPDEILDRQIEQLRSMGVKFETNVRIGEKGDVSLAQLKQDYKAVCVATGSSIGKTVPVPGADKHPIYNGLGFLADVRSGKITAIDDDIVVIGGGNVAIDAAISAKKLGAQRASIVCLEKDGAMPAFASGIEEAKIYGINIYNSFGPQEILGTDVVSGIKIKQCLSLINEKGQFDPSYDENNCKELTAKTIIFAIGQGYDFGDFAKDFEHSRRGIVVDGITFQTSEYNVFAAGDAVTGPASVIKAITTGREAAESINRLLRGIHLHADRGEVREIADKLPEGEILTAPRRERQYTYSDTGFAESMKGFDIPQALEESLRCMTCGSKSVITYRDDCMTCFFCELRCPGEAIDVHPFKEKLPLTLENKLGGF